MTIIQYYGILIKKRYNYQTNIFQFWSIFIFFFEPPTTIFVSGDDRITSTFKCEYDYNIRQWRVAPQVRVNSGFEDRTSRV